MATIKLQAGTHRTNGADPLINSVTLAAGSNVLSAEIDNSVNKDQFCSAEMSFICNTSRTSGLEIYILYAVDGTNYEDGGTTIDPAKSPVYIFRPRTSLATAQRQLSKIIFLQPYKFKVLIKSELDGEATGVTLKLYTHNHSIV